MVAPGRGAAAPATLDTVGSEPNAIPGKHSGTLLDAVYRKPGFQGRSTACRPRRRRPLLEPQGRAHPRRIVRAVLLRRRSRAPRDRRGRGQATPRDGFRAPLPDGASGRLRGGAAGCRLDSGRFESRVLRQLGLRGRGHGPQDRPRLRQCPRRGTPPKVRLARAGLSRRQRRRHLVERHHEEPRGLRRHDARRRAHAPHLAA